MPTPTSRLLVILCGAAAVLLLLIGLRREAEKPIQDTVAAHSSEDPDDSESGYNQEFGSTKVSRILKVEPPPIAKNRKPPVEFVAQQTESFEAEQKRALGDSYIVGNVRQDRNRPVPGARVQLFENDPNTTNPPLREAVADEKGSFTLTQLHSGDRKFVMVTKADGLAPDARYVSIQGAPADIDIWMSKPVTLSGTVINSVTSEPIAGVTVVHPNASDEVFGVLGSTLTGPTGNFSFSDCAPNRVITRASLEGYRTVTTRLRAPSTTATIMLTPGGSKVRGVAVDRLTSKPQSGARVWLEGRRFKNSVITGEDGAFEFKDLAGGSYEIYAVRGMRGDRQEFDLGENETKEGISLTLPSALFVSGKVVDANEGKLLPGVRIWFRSPSGNNSVVSDKDGLFAFDTMAIDKYTIRVHHKGYLPVQGKKTTESLETLTRPVPQNSSSDSFVLKLKPVAAIQGNVVASRRQDSPPQPVFNADITVDYLQGDDLEKLTAKTDPNGDFFVNILAKKRGDAKVIAFKNNAIDAATVKVPSRKTVKLNLQRTMVFGSVLLSDQSPLDGIRIGISHFLPENSEHAMIIKERDFYTGMGGRFYFPLPDKQKVQLTFHFPDEQQIAKTYQSDNLLNRRCTFVYDPVTNDVLLDAGNQWQGRSNRGAGQGSSSHNGNGQGGGQRDGNRQPSNGQNQNSGQGAQQNGGRPK